MIYQGLPSKSSCKLNGTNDLQFHLSLQIPALMLAVLFLISCHQPSKNTVVCAQSPRVDFPGPMQSKDSNTNRVAALTFTEDSKYLLVASAADRPLDSSVQKIQISDARVTNSFVLESLDPTMTRFSGNGQFIVSTLAGHVTVWNTNNGAKVFSLAKTTTQIRDLAITYDGTWIIEGAPGFSIYSPLGKQGGSGFSTLDQKDRITETAVAFNRTGNMIAYGQERGDPDTGKGLGEVGIKGWNEHQVSPATLLDLGLIRFAVSDHNPIETAPLDLEFDPNDKWLAILGKNYLEIAKKNFPRDREGTGLPYTLYGALSFNPDSSLLGVAFSEGVRVYTIPDLKKVMDESGPQITTVAFSPDGCRLAWGDVEGTVHIINAPKP